MADGLLCRGAGTLDQTRTLACKTDSRLADVASSQSCVRELLLADSESVPSCSSSSSCMVSSVM